MQNKDTSNLDSGKYHLTKTLVQTKDFDKCVSHWNYNI